MRRPAFLLMFALLHYAPLAVQTNMNQGGPDVRGNCRVDVGGRLIFPAYATPIEHVSILGLKLDPDFPCTIDCREGLPYAEIFSGPDGFFRFGYAQSGKTYAIVLKAEGMEPVRQKLVVPADHSPLGCFPTPGIHLDVLLHPESKPSVITEDAVGIETLARKTPDKVVQAFEKSMDKKSKTDPKEMSATLLEMLKTTPDYYAANLELGFEYQKEGHREDSIRTLTHALDINSGSMLARSALGQYSYESGDFKKAAELLSEAARLGSRSSGVYYMLGASFLQLGQLDLAEASLVRALAIVPSVVKAHMQLYNLYMKRQQPDKALSEADTYLKNYPAAPDRDYVQSMADKLRKTLKPQP